MSGSRDSSKGLLVSDQQPGEVPTFSVLLTMLTLLSCGKASSIFDYINCASVSSKVIQQETDGAPGKVKLDTMVAMEDIILELYCNRKEIGQAILSQLWFKESALINGKDDQFLGGKLSLQNLNQKYYGKYTYTERDESGKQTEYRIHWLQLQGEGRAGGHSQPEVCWLMPDYISLLCIHQAYSD